MGNPCVRTPNIDRLASEGTVFTRHVASNSLCMPSRASLLTGRYPPAHGVWINGVALNRGDHANLPSPPAAYAEPPTMADLFAGAGYDTVAFGKLHLTPFLASAEHGYREASACWADGKLDDWHGPYYGFRHVDLLPWHGERLCSLGHYGVWLGRHHPDVQARVLAERDRHERPVPDLQDLYASPLPGELHYSAWLGQRFCKYIGERPKDRPFFAFVGFPDPHHPFTPSRDVLEEFAGCDVQEPMDPEGSSMRGSPAEDVLVKAEMSAEHHAIIARHTYAMVYQIDLAVGRMLDALDRAGLRDETVVVFTSDHGEFLCDHGMLRKCLFAFDTLLRVPFVMRAPGAGLPHRVDAPMSNVDVLPTLAALAGLPPPEYVQGRDIRPVLASGEEHHAFSFLADGHPRHVNYTVYDRDCRLTLYPNAGYEEMFDHRTDPAEMVNVAGDPDYRERREALTAVLKDRLPTCWSPPLARVAAW